MVITARGCCYLFIFFLREAAVAIAVKIVSYVIATLVRYHLKKMLLGLKLNICLTYQYAISDMKSILELFNLQVTCRSNVF